MDIAEFAEKFMNVELCEWQKQHLRALDKMRGNGDIRIVTGRRGQMYVYMNQAKELIRNGSTNDCK